MSIAGAKAVLINITANEDLLFEEFNDASAYINDALGEADTNIIIGCATDENAGDEIRITVIATGIEGNAAPKVVQGRPAPAAPASAAAAAFPFRAELPEAGPCRGARDAPYAYAPYGR